MNRSAALRLGLLATIWGTSFVFIKVSLEGLSPLQIAVARIGLGAAVLLGIVALRSGRLPRGWSTWGHLAVVGVLANVVPFFLFGWAEQRVPSSLAGIYNATTPLFTLLAAMTALRSEERATLSRLAGLLLGFLGVVVVLAPWRGLGSAALNGQLACLTAGACYGLAITYTRRYLSGRGYSALALAAGQLLCAAAELVLLAPLWAAHPVSLPWRVSLSILALGGLGTGIAYLIFYGLIGEIGATAASTVTYLVPVVAVALGVAVLREAVGWNDFAGAVVVLLGVAVAGGQLDRGRRPPS